MLGVLLLAGMILFSPSDKGELRGTVIYDNGHTPVPGANVVLAGTGKGMVTDAEGRFAFQDLPAGTYNLDVSYVGCRKQHLANIQVQNGEITAVSVNLVVSPFNVDEVVVTGTLNKHLLKDSPVLTEVVGERELAVIGSKDLSEVLQAQTGIEIETGIGQTQNVSLHGLNDNHVLVLVDGERVAGKVDGAIDLGQVPLTLVDRIEIVKGPLSSIYGSDALGGVINIITKDPTRSEVRLTATLGNLGRQDYDASISHAFADLFGDGRSLRVVGDVSVNKADGVDYVPADHFMEMPRFDRLNLNVRAIGQMSSRLTAEVRADHYRDDLDWMAGDIGVTYLVDYAHNEKTSLAAIGTYTLSDEASLKVSASKSQNDRRSWETTAAGYLTSDSYARELLETYRAQGTLVPYTNSILTLGAEYNDESMNSSRFSGGPRSVSNRVLYAEDEWNLGVGTLAIGGRYSDNSAFGAVLAPRVSVMVPLTEHTTLRASYGRGYREPSLLERFIDFDHSSVGYIVVGNPALVPEDSRGFTAGVQYNRDDIVWFRVTYFLNTLHNLIDYYVAQSTQGGSAAVLSYRNVNRAVTQGVDIDADLSLISGTMVSIGYAYVDARDGYGYRLPFRTPNTLNVKMNAALPFWSSALDLRLRWFDRKPVNDEQVNSGIYSQGQAPSFSYVPAYLVADVRLSSKPAGLLECFIGVNNVFDQTRYPFGQIKPRQVYVGTSVTLP